LKDSGGFFQLQNCTFCDGKNEQKTTEIVNFGSLAQPLNRMLGPGSDRFGSPLPDMLYSKSMFRVKKSKPWGPSPGLAFFGNRESTLRKIVGKRLYFRRKDDGALRSVPFPNLKLGVQAGNGTLL
jgi:hypothetical protein